MESCLRVNNMQAYLKTNEWVLRKIISQGSTLSEYLNIGEGKIHFSVKAGKNVKIIGPVIVGPETIIENNVTIIGPSIIGQNSCIREGAVICRSIIWDDCTIAKNCFVDQCVIPARAQIRSKARICNTLCFASKNSAGDDLKISKSACEVCERKYTQIPYSRLFFMEKRLAARTSRM